MDGVLSENGALPLLSGSTDDAWTPSGRTPGRKPVLLDWPGRETLGPPLAMACVPMEMCECRPGLPFRG